MPASIRSSSRTRPRPNAQSVSCTQRLGRGAAPARLGRQDVAELGLARILVEVHGGREAEERAGVAVQDGEALARARLARLLVGLEPGAPEPGRRRLGDVGVALDVGVGREALELLDVRVGQQLQADHRHGESIADRRSPAGASYGGPAMDAVRLVSDDVPGDDALDAYSRAVTFVADGFRRRRNLRVRRVRAAGASESVEARRRPATAPRRAGDLVLALDGAAVEDVTALQRLMTGDLIGMPVTVTIAREERVVDLELVADEL